MDELRAAYRAVRSRLEPLRLPWDLPPHLIWRLVAAVGDEEVVHADADLQSTEPRTYSGGVLLFTASRVVLATMTDGPQQPQPHQAATFSVQLATWRRTRLTAVEFNPDSTGWSNSDAGWSVLGNDLDYPPDFALTLVYEGREPLTLPLYGGTNRGRASSTLYAFLPALLADLRQP
jgi:hypothetical protein